MMRNNATKVPVYQAIMMKNISNPEFFMGKQDNLRFEVVCKNKENGGESEQNEKTSTLTK